MKFIIMSEREIRDYKTDMKHIIISISSPNALTAIIPPNKKCLGILRLVFHDLDGTNNPSKSDYTLFTQGKYTLFTEKQAQAILNFVTRYILNVEVVICQCEAGISRSAGVAGALSKIINGDDTYIFKNYVPNILVYRTILEVSHET